MEGEEEVHGVSELTSTRETIDGLLRLDGDELLIQWRLRVTTEHLAETDEELGDVTSVVLPLDRIAGVEVRHRWWELWLGPRLVLTATDMLAFEQIADEAGFHLSHPAQLVVRLRRGDRLAAEEFAAEMSSGLANERIREPPERSP